MSAQPGTADVAEVETVAEEQWRRLSPRMLVVHPLNELIRAAPALLAVLVVGATSGRGPWWTLLGVGVLVVLGALRWFTTTYRVTPRQGSAPEPCPQRLARAAWR